MSTGTLSVNTPMSEPNMAHAKATMPPFFGPSLFSTMEAGMAMTIPTSENRELSQPAVAISILNAPMRVVMQGATLFCTSASEMPAKMVANATIQARFVFIKLLSFSYTAARSCLHSRLGQVAIDFRSASRGLVGVVVMRLHEEERNRTQHRGDCQRDRGNSPIRNSR